jgi:hypothetical protein
MKANKNWSARLCIAVSIDSEAFDHTGVFERWMHRRAPAFLPTERRLRFAMIRNQE